MADSLFITFEGIEACGKSTQVSLLANALQHRGIQVQTTKEPGGTIVGTAIRNILLDSSQTQLDSATELFLFLADRALHVNEVVKPALAKGNVVLCDRYSDSTLAYQHFGLGLSEKFIKQGNQHATGGLEADITIYLDVPVNVSLSRIQAAVPSPDRIEIRPNDFHQRVREGFLTIANSNSDRIHIVNGTNGITDIHEAIVQIVNKRLG